VPGARGAPDAAAGAVPAPTVQPLPPSEPAPSSRSRHRKTVEKAVDDEKATEKAGE
jgi:hypothetical protein